MERYEMGDNTSEVERRIEDAMGILNGINITLRPKRVRPDLTRNEANVTLTFLLYRNPKLDWSDSQDVYVALRTFKNLPEDKKYLFNNMISKPSEYFILKTKSIWQGGTIIHVIPELEVNPYKRSKEVMVNVYTSMCFVVDLDDKTMKITAFFPYNATLRGYSIGRLIIDELEMIARNLKLTHMLIDEPLADAEDFYTNIGFKINPQDSTSMIREINYKQ